MIIRSIEPIQYKRTKAGLSGGYKVKGLKEKNFQQKSFEEYLLDAFQGDIVQNGKWFSNSLSDLAKHNIVKI